MCRILRGFLPRTTLLLITSSIVMTANSAGAWNRETHRSIVEAAFIISPAAEARLGAVDRGALLQASEEADPSDPECRLHPVAVGSRDAASRAEELFNQVISAKGALATRYFRAQSIGRLLHFVADAAVPQDMPVADAGTGSRFFPSQHFVVFRERGPLGMPLTASLRERGAQARWSVNSETNHAAAFRLAANLVADVLLLLPPEPGAKEFSDSGPVIFAIDRLDTGLGSTAYRYKYLRSDIEYDYYLEERKADSSANRLTPLPDRPGLQIVEWLTRPQDRSTTVRALLLNNDKRCATRIILSRGSWSAPLSMTIAPYSLKVVELSYPSDVSREKLSGRWDSYDCSGPFAMEFGISSATRFIVASSNSGPVFDTSSRVIDMLGPGRTTVLTATPPSEGGPGAIAGDGKARAGEDKTGVSPAVSAPPFFGKRSVLALVRATEVRSDLSGCPKRPVKVSCFVQNVSKTLIYGLKARLLVEDPYLGKTTEKIQPLNPPDILPGDQAEVSLSQPCDWGQAGGKYVFVLNDVSGTVAPR
jgi:hypothetical protein